MKTLFAFALLLFAFNTVGAQTADELFLRCVQKTGKDYVEARQAFLAHPNAKALAEAKAESQAGQERITARILLGWVEHAKLYHALLQETQIKNLLQEERFAWLLVPSELQPSHGPLLLEMIFKDTESAPNAWAAAEGFSTLVRQGGAVDVPALHGFLRENTQDRPLVRVRVAFLLRSLPARRLNADDFLTTLQAELKQEKKDVEVVKFLAQGLSAAAEKLTNQERDQLTETLSKNPALKEILGEIGFVHTIGEVGGDVSARVVAAYLRKADSTIEKHWALETLGKSGSELATPIIVDYVKTEDPGSLRSMAIRGLGTVPYQEEVGKTLVQVVGNSKNDQADRLRALKSLDLLHARNLDNPKIGDLIAGQLEELLKRDLQNPTVLRMLRQTVEAVERRKKP